MDRISVMRAFCRIVELNSFSKAAEDLGVSSALLSRQTKLLEESLGCLLISRTTRSMALTEHGQLYYTEACRLLGELDTLDDRLRNDAGSLKGTLKVNAPLSFGIAVLSPMLPGFMEQHPDVRVVLNLDDRVLDMVEGGFDISIRIRADLPDSGLIAWRIGTVRQQLLAAPSYLEKQGRPQCPDDLSDHKLLSFSLADHSTQWALSHLGKTDHVDLSPSVIVNNSLFLRDQLIAGLGIGSLPSFIFEPALAEGTLECVLPDFAMANRTVFAVIADRLGADTKTKAFVEHLKNYLASTPTQGILNTA